jgi:uncharacterized protein YggE
MRKVFFVARIIVLATSVLCAQASTASAQENQDQFSLPHITVSGSSYLEAKPDIATLRLGVVNEKNTAAAAAAETAKGATAAIAMLKDLGIDPKDIKTTNLTISPVVVEDRDPKTSVVIKRTLTGYRASNSLDVRIRDIDKAGAVATRVVEAGANNFRGIFFSVSDQEAQTDNLRAKAVGDAMRRAALYAGGASMKLGRLLAIDPQPDYGSAADLPSRREIGPIVMPVEPGVTQIHVNVRATWELVPQ